MRARWSSPTTGLPMARRRLRLEHGARVVPVPLRGYGAALNAGIQAARGKYVLMADADDSYEFAHIPRFLAELRGGLRTW